MKKILYLLLPFSYLFILLFQIDQSMLEDLGRHLKMGEAIMQCLCVPQTNLFSYTNADFPVVNHEWLTQVVLFFFYKNFGLQSLLILKMIILTIAFGIVYYVAKQKSSWYWLTIISLLCIIIFSARFRVRPEMFSYLFIALFLLIIFLYEKGVRHPRLDRGSSLDSHFRENDKGIPIYMRLLRRLRLLAMTRNILLLLPVIQVFWVNMHIYFILGIMMYGTFLAERMVSVISNASEKSQEISRRFTPRDDNMLKKVFENHELRFLFLIGGLLILATLLNPKFILGALLPFTFSSNYGLSVQENMSVFEFGKYAPSFIYTLTLQVMTFEVLAGIFLILIPVLFKKTLIAPLLNGLFSAILGLRYVRTISLFGLLGLQPLTEKLTILENRVEKKTDRYFINTVKALIFAITLFVSYLYAHGLYQNNVLKFGYQPYAEDATNFINNNQLKGPIFNNYHIGNYLIYGLYPKEKIFIDARPEMYPTQFLKEYERMLVDQDFFNQQVKKYGINLIVFGVQLEDPATIRPFMLRQIQSNKWIPIFADGNVTVMIKNTKENQEIITKLRITSRIYERFVV